MLIRRVLSLLVAVVLASPAYAIERQQHNRFAGLTVSGAALFADGTAGDPSIAFSSDADGTGTGIYRSAADNPVIVSNGVGMLSIAPSGVFVLAEELYVPNGTAAAPSYSFNNDPNTGLYRVGADQIGVSAGGALVATFDSGGLILNGTTSPQIRQSVDTEEVLITGGSSDSAGNGAYLFLQGDDRGGVNAGAGAVLNVGDNAAAKLSIVHNVTEVALFDSVGLEMAAGKYIDAADDLLLRSLTDDVVVTAMDDIIFFTNGTPTERLRIDDGNAKVAVTGEFSVTGTTTSTGVVCVKADGNYGQCTSAVGAGGTCTCA